MKDSKEFRDVLIGIQSELKAPKNQRNNFGNYNYRSAEDILEAVKPLLNKYGCFLTISDAIEHIGDRYYVKATATITDGTNIISTTAFAREEENKKGQDGSQITGSASSYARKYALNGLFCIDDTKDADSTNTHGKTETKADDLKTALAEANAAKNIEDLQKVWVNWAKYHTNAQFKKLVNDLKQKLKNAA